MVYIVKNVIKSSWFFVLFSSLFGRKVKLKVKIRIRRKNVIEEKISLIGKKVRDFIFPTFGEKS